MWYASVHVPDDYILYIAPMGGGQSENLACGDMRAVDACRVPFTLYTHAEAHWYRLHRSPIERGRRHVGHGRTLNTLLVGVIVADCVCTRAVLSEKDFEGTVAM